MRAAVTQGVTILKACTALAREARGVLGAAQLEELLAMTPLRMLLGGPAMPPPAPPGPR